jgi:hypothetical protein
MTTTPNSKTIVAPEPVKTGPVVTKREADNALFRSAWHALSEAKGPEDRSKAVSALAALADLDSDAKVAKALLAVGESLEDWAKTAALFAAQGSRKVPVAITARMVDPTLSEADSKNGSLAQRLGRYAKGGTLVIAAGLPTDTDRLRDFRAIGNDESVPTIAVLAEALRKNPNTDVRKILRKIEADAKTAAIAAEAAKVAEAEAEAARIAAENGSGEPESDAQASDGSSDPDGSGEPESDAQGQGAGTPHSAAGEPNGSDISEADAAPDTEAGGDVFSLDRISAQSAERFLANVILMMGDAKRRGHAGFTTAQRAKFMDATLAAQASVQSVKPTAPAASKVAASK